MPIGIEEENVPGGILIGQHRAPIVADVVFDIGVGLHEDQSRTGRSSGQFLFDPGAAIFLLRGRDQQHVAVRQYFSQAGKIAVGLAQGSLLRSCLGRVGIGTIDQHQIAEHGQIAGDQFDAGRIDAQHFRRDIAAADERGPSGGGPLASGLHHVGA